MDPRKTLDLDHAREMRRIYRAGKYNRQTWDYWGVWSWGFFWGCFTSFCITQLVMWMV